MLWDIKGKFHDATAHQLLGGRPEQNPCLRLGWRRSFADIVQSVQQASPTVSVQPK